LDCPKLRSGHHRRGPARLATKLLFEVVEAGTTALAIGQPLKLVFAVHHFCSELHRALHAMRRPVFAVAASPSRQEVKLLPPHLPIEVEFYREVFARMRGSCSRELNAYCERSFSLDSSSSQL